MINTQTQVALCYHSQVISSALGKITSLWQTEWKCDHTVQCTQQDRLKEGVTEDHARVNQALDYSQELWVGQSPSEVVHSIPLYFKSTLLGRGTETSHTHSNRIPSAFPVLWGISRLDLLRWPLTRPPGHSVLAALSSLLGAGMVWVRTLCEDLHGYRCVYEKQMAFYAQSWCCLLQSNSSMFPPS